MLSYDQTKIGPGRSIAGLLQTGHTEGNRRQRQRMTAPRSGGRQPSLQCQDVWGKCKQRLSRTNPDLQLCVCAAWQIFFAPRAHVRAILFWRLPGQAMMQSQPLKTSSSKVLSPVMSNCFTCTSACDWVRGAPCLVACVILTACKLKENRTVQSLRHCHWAAANAA